MLHYTTGTYHKNLRMNMEDGLVEELCMLSQTSSFYLCYKFEKWFCITINISIYVYACRKDFTAYADVCFREFGDRVKYWTTINEANVYAMFGYDVGNLPPQRCSPPSTANCSRGNSSTEPYLAAHHMLLAHASAARLYRKKYQV